MPLTTHLNYKFAEIKQKKTNVHKTDVPKLHHIKRNEVVLSVLKWNIIERYIVDIFSFELLEMKYMRKSDETNEQLTVEF